MISGSDISNVVIEDLCLSGSGINGASSIGIRFTLSALTNTQHVVLRNLFVNDQAGNGISLSTPILTTLQNVKVRYVAGDGFSVSNGTSTNFYDCFAVTGLGAGFKLDTMTYCSLVGCAAEVFGISYLFNNCSALSVVSCGSEDPIDRSSTNSGYTGISFRNSEVSSTSRVSLYSCYSRDPRTPGPSGHISGSFHTYNFRAQSGSQALTPLKIFGTAEFVGNVTASSYTSSINNAVGFLGTSSFAVSASWAPGGGSGGSGTGFPFSGSAVITGSLLISGSGLRVTGSTDVVGNFTATTKSFLIEHQKLPGKKLIYGVLEGPEHAVFIRGKLHKQNLITLPEEWEWLVDPNTITVQLTPIGSHQKLFVKQIVGRYITVENDGLFTSDVSCYYLVHAERKDVPPLETVI